MRRIVAALCVTLCLATADGGSASAHAGLQRCSIRNNQVFRVGREPRRITATFAEPLDPARSWMAVFEGQADHGLVTERQRSLVNFKNPREMTLQLPKLGRERYYLIWYTHSTADNHVAAGIVYFQVK